MSAHDEVAADAMYCAACGITEVDDIKLKRCNACKSARYCSVKCQREHRPLHKKYCKKRATELRDEVLFKQPESTHLGDCPICFLPLSLDAMKSAMMACCSTLICSGCDVAKMRREREEMLEHKCAFCRHPAPKSHADGNLIMMKRFEANDPAAIRRMGKMFLDDEDFESAFEHYAKAARLGDTRSHHQLAFMYRDGQGVEKDKKKEIYHFEEAAIGGHPVARHQLGCHEEANGRMNRAVKHWIVSANLGFDLSLDAVRECYVVGLVSKDEFATGLRAHQAATDASRSPQREAAEKLPHKLD